MKRLSQADVRLLGAMLVFFVAYFVVATIGIRFGQSDGLMSFIWPPTAIALAALFLYGSELWPAIALGAFLANFLAGASVPSSIVVAGANTIQAMIGALVLRYFLYNPLLSRLRDSLIIIVGSFTISIVAPTIRVLGLSAIGELHNSATLMWLLWWETTSLGMVTVAPFLILWL